MTGEKVKTIIERTDTLYIPPLNGGRGAGDGTQKSFKFGHASDGNGNRKDKQLLPAKANVRIKSKTMSSAIEKFRAKNGNSDHEWTYEVDDNVYVHQYVEFQLQKINIK